MKPRQSRGGDDRTPRRGDFAQVARSIVQEATDESAAADEREAQRLRDDPATQEWLEETRSALASGALAAEHRDQPPLDEVIASLRARR